MHYIGYVKLGTQCNYMPSNEAQQWELRPNFIHKNNIQVVVLHYLFKPQNITCVELLHVQN
jgi:hypothetical protein